MINTKLTVFSNKPNQPPTYAISRYNSKTKSFDSVPIPPTLGLLILDMYSCTLYKTGTDYQIYNL